jgi:predicted DNA-binding transcriptional regulator AlpA
MRTEDTQDIQDNKSHPQTMVTSPLFYSVPDAARLIGTAPVTLYRAIREGEFPAMRIRGRVVVPARAIEAMVDAAVAEQAEVAASRWTVVQR